MTGLLSVRPPLPPGVLARRRPADPPFPLGDDRCRLYSRARHGLYAGLQALALRPGDEVLVPSWHHGSEIEALVRGRLALRWYGTPETLEPDADELEALLGPRTRALYLVHYLGFPQRAAWWRRWCDERGLLLFEDAAQAWLASSDGRPVGSDGDLAIFCLYKTIGLPDGAALIMAGEPPPPPTAPAGAGHPLLRRHAAWLTSRSAPLGALELRLAADRNGYDPREDFDLGRPDSAPCHDTLLVLARAAERTAADRRRANYLALLDAVGDLVPAPFDRVPDGASPFAFPVSVTDKASLLERLDRCRIRALDFWSVAHPALPAGVFPAAAARRRSTVCLPVHQELRPEDVERIALAVTGRRPGCARLRVTVHEDLDELRTELDALAERTRNIFATGEWLATWWRHFGRHRSLWALGLRDAGGRLVAALPLYAWHERPLRALRFLGHGVGDQLGPICERSDRVRVASTARDALRASRWDMVVGDHVPAGDGWTALLGGRSLSRSASPVLRFGAGGWAEFLASRTSNFRAQVGSRERRLYREHDVGVRLSADPARFAEDLDTLFRLHSARRPEGSSFTACEAFQRDFAHRALARGWMRLWLLEIDGVPRAAWYGFRFAGVESFYQSGRDPDWARSSIGFVLTAHAARAAADDGMTEYRHLRGDEPYKYRFATHDAALETIAVPSGAAGTAAVTGAALAPRGLVRRTA
jgi:perosamine synthetase